MSAPECVLRIAARFLRSRRFCEALAENLCNQLRKVLQLFVTPGTDIDAHLVRAVGKPAENLCSKWGGASTSLRDSTANITSDYLPLVAELALS